MRITQKMRKQLYAQLSCNDILYEIFKRQRDDIHRLAKRYIHDRKKIVSVIGKDDTGNYRRFQVLDVQVSDAGTQVEVRLC